MINIFYSGKLCLSFIKINIINDKLKIIIKQLYIRKKIRTLTQNNL